ncbi:MAG: sulfite exporter TauE/SafE family protein [Holophagaceae bacterium]|nr:sulfite exporter TauE/SafE family protein [Holophagaceae bacterium]
MSPLFEALAGFGSGLAGGVLSGMFGIGGGVVLVPLLGLALHLNQHQAQGVTLAAMLLPNGLPAVLHYRKMGVTILWNLVGILVLGFLVGVYGGSVLANRIPEAPLRWGFSGLLVLMAVRMIAVRKDPSLAPQEPLAVLPSPWVPGLCIGLVGGAASGLLGIGGGLVIIPLLTAWVRMPQHQAQATSLAVMLPPIFLPGVLVYAAAQKGLPWPILGGVAAGFMAGAFFGARLATSVKGPALRITFAVIMVAMAALLLLR